MTWKIEVSDACIGSGMCSAIAPDEFDLSSGYAEPVSAEMAEDEALLDAADSCPASAITVTDTATGTVVGPRD